MSLHFYSDNNLLIPLLITYSKIAPPGIMWLLCPPTAFSVTPVMGI